MRLRTNTSADLFPFFEKAYHLLHRLVLMFDKCDLEHKVCTRVTEPSTRTNVHLPPIPPIDISSTRLGCRRWVDFQTYLYSSVCHVTPAIGILSERCQYWKINWAEVIAPLAVNVRLQNRHKENEHFIFNGHIIMWTQHCKSNKGYLFHGSLFGLLCV